MKKDVVHINKTGWILILLWANIIKKDYILVETTGQNNIQPLDIRIAQCKNVIDTIFKYFDV